VFTGAMDYWPNVDAVQWFATRSSRPARQRFPGLRFYIVGARPAPAVQALGQRPAWTVTGTVPDVRPYIAHAQVAVAPLRIARGIQNKVLEAMAMATPVVVSPQALEGIDAEPGSELVLADDAPPSPTPSPRCWRGQATAPRRHRPGRARQSRTPATAGPATWPASGRASNVPETAPRRRRRRHPPRLSRAPRHRS
jgi:hypothetical protein